MTGSILNSDPSALKPRLLPLKYTTLSQWIKKEEIQCLIYFYVPVPSPMYGVGRYSVMKVESVMQTKQCLPVSLEHFGFSVPGRSVVKEIRCYELWLYI